MSTAASTEPPGNPSAIHEWSMVLDQVANAVAELAFDTARTTASIRERAEWTGSAATAYTSFCENVTSPLSRISMPLHEVAAAARLHAETLFTVQAQVRDAAAELAEAQGTASPVASLVAQATSERAEATAMQSAQTAADSVDGSDSAIKSFWEATEPIRKVLEAVLAPFDIVAADHWIDILKDLAGLPREWVGELDSSIAALEGVIRQGGHAAIEEALIDVADEADNVGTKIDALFGFTPNWFKSAAGALSEIRGLSNALTGLGILADLGTMISPQDGGALGWIDRGVAGVNAGLLAANACLDEIPIVGEVVLIGTGVYLAGDFLYHHWTPFRDVCNSVGHVFMSGVTWTTEHGLASATSWVEHSASGIASTVENWL